MGPLIVFAVEILSVKLIVKVGAATARGRRARTPLSLIQIARIYAHSSPTGIYPTLLFTYPFICFAPISPDREFLCLHAPVVCPRKAATCERFRATITQFSSE